MKYEIEMLKEKRVAGFCQRTGNQNKDMPVVIGGLWKKWETVSELQGRKNEKWIGMYTDYEDMEYDVTVGYEMKKDASPAGGRSRLFTERNHCACTRKYRKPSKRVYLQHPRQCYKRMFHPTETNTK